MIVATHFVLKFDKGLQNNGPTNCVNEIAGTNAEDSMLLMGLDSLSGKPPYQQRSEYLKPRNVGRKLPNRPEILLVLR